LEQDYCYSKTINNRFFIINWAEVVGRRNAIFPPAKGVLWTINVLYSFIGAI